MRRSVTAITVIVLAAFSVGAGGEPISNGILSEPSYLDLEKAELFPIDESIRERVRFWVDIYAKYSSWQAVVHDKLYPQVIYGVAESTNKEKRPAPFRTQSIQANAREMLLKLHKNRAAIKTGKFTLNPEEQRIVKLFETIPGDDKFLNAASPKRFRHQYGLKDSLLEALKLSGRYLRRMEKLLQDEGLPGDIAYLPFVESSFNKSAVSKVGASGIWQIMPGTGKEFLRVDDIIDERNDPMRAANAAAMLLKQNYEALGTWPLAITAYNHGKLGMARAVKSVGTKELPKIIEKYDGPNFGFASANFYASYLAAKHVAKNADHYLGKVEKARILEFDEFVVPDYVEANDLAKYINVPIDDLKDLNPALLSDVWSGKYYVPVGYVLRVPLTVRDSFLPLYEKIPEHLKHAQQKEMTGAKAEAKISSAN